MRVDVALLCDFCTVRDNLLHILGGGITEIERPAYPAPMGVGLALRVLAHPTEVKASHTLRVLILAEDGDEVQAIQVETGIVEKLPEPTQDANLVVPFMLHSVLLPEKGRYSVEVLIDGLHQKSVPLEAREVDPTINTEIPRP